MTIFRLDRTKEILIINFKSGDLRCRFWLLFRDSVTILHGCEFWGVDKVKSAANCKWPLALYLEQHSTFWGFTGKRQHAMRTSILSPGSMCQSVIFGSLTLRNTNNVILGWNIIFQKFVLSLSCSTFSRQLKISEMQDQNNRITIAGKYLKKAAGNCYSQFSDIKIARE